MTFNEEARDLEQLLRHCAPDELPAGTLTRVALMLRAACDALAAPAVEPVAWRWRWRIDSEEWSAWYLTDEPPRSLECSVEAIPLYAAPAVKADVIRSPLFQMFLRQGFWHAHHVDLVWRYNGADVREEADWLKDLWYAVKGDQR